MQSPFEGAEEAVAILSKGVEPLKSQFTVDYGMALGLLQSYSISEAKSLVEKSFGNYLGTKVLIERERKKEREKKKWVAPCFFLTSLSFSLLSFLFYFFKKPENEKLPLELDSLTLFSLPALELQGLEKSREHLERIRLEASSIAYEREEMARTYQEFGEYAQAEESVADMEARLLSLITKRRKANMLRLLAMEGKKGPRNILVIRVPPLATDRSHVRYVRSIPLDVNSELGKEKSPAEINSIGDLKTTGNVNCASMLQTRFGISLHPDRTTGLKKSRTRRSASV